MTPKRIPRPDPGVVRSLANALEIPINLAAAGGTSAAAAMAELKQGLDAGSGGLRMNHVAQAQRHMASLDPSRHGQLVQHLQGVALSLGGRGRDTQIAHVTPGEVVLPESLMTPEVVDLLRRAAKEKGLDPDRFVVGSDSNSINPQTGQPEFLYEDPDDPNARSQVAPSPGQQVADVYVSDYPRKANLAGHMGIGVNTPATQGFYPAQSQNMKEFEGNNVPGAVKNDDLNSWHLTTRIPTTPEQDQAVQDYINTRAQNPGDYNLYDRNCSEFVGGALGAGGISVPTSDEIPNWYYFKGIRPKY